MTAHAAPTGVRQLAGWRAWGKRHAALLSIDPLERRLGGRAGGIMWLVGGVTLAVYPLLPDAIYQRVGIIYALVAAAVSWGLLTLFVIDWTHAKPVVTHLSTFAAFGAIAWVLHLTGASHSGAWVFLFWVALFGCYFYSTPVALFYIGLCVLVQATPLFYDSQALKNGYLSELVIATVGYLTVGGCVVAGKRMVDGLRRQSATLAAEQGALQRAASAVVRGEEPNAVYTVVIAEFARLLGGDAGGVFQLVAPDRVRIVGGWAEEGSQWPSVGALAELVPGSAITEAIRTGEVSCVGDLPPGSVGYGLGYASGLAAPITLDGAIWGVLAIAHRNRDAFEPVDEPRIEAFSSLACQIITSLRDRARLATEALTDQLTGLANHRALHQRLEAELTAVQRHGGVLSVAMIDVDNFKEINDLAGHAVGDETLRVVARCLTAVAGSIGTIGRLGGDEFMWIMPDTDSHQALMAVERARDLIAATPVGPKIAYTSAGVADTVLATDPAELVRLADMALYTSKGSGRNRATIYDPKAASLSPSRRQELLERSQVLVGLRALARAIDAKDPATSEHSERVAAIAGRLAKAADWPSDEVARLREAALVHDVGKLAISAHLLTKQQKLTPAERAEMDQHVEISARIVGSVLSEEQVSWIRSHHERPDGRGYPHRLTAGAIPDGAALIALADAWDVMVVGRPYSAPKTTEEAYQECVSLRGVQFTDAAINALVAARRDGWLELGPEPAPDAREGPLQQIQA